MNFLATFSKLPSYLIPFSLRLEISALHFSLKAISKSKISENYLARTLKV